MRYTTDQSGNITIVTPSTTTAYDRALAAYRRREAAAAAKTQEV